MVGKLLTIREVASFLDITEKEVIELSEKGIIPAYKVGGLFLRFKKEQIEGYKSKLQKPDSPGVRVNKDYSFSEKVSDFFYFYDFYILSIMLILILFMIIIKS